MMFMTPSVYLQGALALRQVAVHVVVWNTPGKLFHITQVCIFIILPPWVFTDYFFPHYYWEEKRSEQHTDFVIIRREIDEQSLIQFLGWIWLLFRVWVFKMHLPYSWLTVYQNSVLVFTAAKVWIVHVWAVLIGGFFCHCFPGLPKQDSGHWWSSFFFGKQPGMGSLAEEAQQKWVTCFWVQKTLNLHNLLNLSFS